MAQVYCNKLGGVLISIDNPTKLGHIKSFLDKGKDIKCLISLFNLKRECYDMILFGSTII